MLAREGVADGQLTAVNATHLTRAEVAILAAPGPVVCACPVTERDLGDGFLPAEELLSAGGRIAIGSDSQTIIAPLEEVRLLEYHERLRKLRRVVLAEQAGERMVVAPGLLDCLTRTGARALRLPAGVLEPGALADFVAVDLGHSALAGWTADTLPELLALCAPPDVVSDVWVDGVQRVRDRTHALEVESVAGFRDVDRRVFA